MNNEIKEIVESSRKIIKSNRENGFDRIIMLGDDIDKLLDYITNLQEIEKEHKNCTRKHWQQKCAEHCVNEMIYKSRIDKAIEYINNHSLNFNNEMEIDLQVEEVKELENILRGEE